MFGAIESIIALILLIVGALGGGVIGRIGAKRQGRKLEREDIADDLMKANERNDREIREALDHRGEPNADAVRDRLLNRLSARSATR